MEYIVATEEDVALAAFLAGEVFGISLDDLAPQTRRLLTHIEKLVTVLCERHDLDRRRVRFIRRELRDHCHWSDTRLRKHLDRLVDAVKRITVASLKGGIGKTAVSAPL